MKFRVLALFALLPVAGCTEGLFAGLDNPYRRVGTWSPEGLNDANIAAQASNSRHLAYGIDDPNSPAALADAAVSRLYSDKIKSLPRTDIGDIGQTR